MTADSSGVTIRDASIADVPVILELINATIPSTTAAWTEELETLDTRLAWFAASQASGDIVLVAEVDVRVVGFCATGEFRDNTKWPGYRFTAELSIHVETGAQGGGVGRRLMDALVERADSKGLHVLVAAIDGENEGSLAFHRTCGFVEVGRMPETGWKHGRWLDLVLVQRVL